MKAEIFLHHTKETSWLYLHIILGKLAELQRQNTVLE